MYDKDIDTKYILGWGEFRQIPMSEIMNDETMTGGCLVSTLTLIDNESEEEIDSRYLVVSDDDINAEEKINGELIYRNLEDLLLTTHNIERASATSVTAW